MSSKIERSNPPELKGVSQANNHLAVNVHRLLAEEEGNIFFSPFSISTAMAMLLCATEGETEAELRAALGYDQAGIDKNDLPSMFQQQISDILESSDTYTFACANAMLCQKNFEIKEKYKSIITESFKALHAEVDFATDMDNVTDQINRWVNENTKSMIPKLLGPLSPLTVIVLLNAVYFKGNWMNRFDKKKTSTQKFYNNGIENKAKRVDMMHIKERFLFVENESFQALQLPYAGASAAASADALCREKIAMLVLLPREKKGLKELEASLTSSFIQDLKSKMVKRKVDVTLPKFRLEYSKSLKSCFQRLGVKKAFISGAELGVASDCRELSVSKIVHKAVLEVNEEGSEASAATAVTVVYRCRTYNPVFLADHPFAFVIYDTNSDLILFMGKVEEL